MIIEILNNKSSINNINSLLEMIQKLLNLITKMEKWLINIVLYNIIFIEKNIFNLIDAIGSICNCYKGFDNMITYLLKLINYDKDHSISIIFWSIKTLSVNISNNTSFLPYIEEEKHKNIVNKSKDKIGKFFQCKKWP